MDPLLMQAIKENTPKINPIIGNGLAYHEGGKILEFVDRLWRMNSSSFPDGMTYLGCEKCSPKEGYQFETRVVNNTTRRYDINKNDIRLCAFIFEYNGQILRKYLYLPFIRPHGFMYLNDTKYVVAPIVSDGVITVKPDSIFVKLIKMKLWFYRIYTQIIVDGQREYGTLYHSKVHNKPNSNEAGQNNIKMKTSLVHYLMCKFGMTKTLEMFGVKNWHMLSKTEFRERMEEFPTKDWVVIESTGKKPSLTYLHKAPYEETPWVFVVKRKEFEARYSVKNVFASIFYTLDHFPSPKRINPDYIDDVDVWRAMLGETIHSSNEHYAVVKDSMDRHIVSLDEYVDEMVRDGFKRIGIEIRDIYDLFIYIIENFNSLISDSNKDINSNGLYGKQLQILNYLLYGIIRAINNCYFSLSGLRIEQQNKPDKLIRIEDIDKCLRAIRPEEILKIKKEHAGIIVVDDPTDLPLLKVGRIVVLQEKSDKRRTSQDNFDVNSPNNRLHESLIESGGALTMSKGDPSGRNRINLFVNLSDDYTIIPNPELAPVMDELRALMGKG